MTAEPTYKYFAFISYNSHDMAWGKRLQRKLESYRLPSTLCSQHGLKRKPIKPVFFAPTDIQPGGLTIELQERLKASRNLIVICSPHSAQSEWVGKEIAFFHSLGRTENIFFFIVDGVPHSGDPTSECFNPVTEELGLPEILGANIHEKIYRWPWLNKERAYVQLITKLLGIEFDTLWNRHKRRLIEQAMAWVAGLIAVLAMVLWAWGMNRPVDVNLKLNEVSVHNSQLPPLKEAIVTMQLDNESKKDTVMSIDESAVFMNIPHRYMNKEVRVTFTCPDYTPVDTTITLSRDASINISRDENVYGNIHFKLWNINTETVISNFPLEIKGHKVVSDAQGMVTLFIPLAEQQQAYHIMSSRSLMNDTIHAPCGKDDIILVE